MMLQNRVSNTEVLRQSDQVKMFSQAIWGMFCAWIPVDLSIPMILFMAKPDPFWKRPPSGDKTFLLEYHEEKSRKTNETAQRFTPRLGRTLERFPGNHCQRSKPVAGGSTWVTRGGKSD